MATWVLIFFLSFSILSAQDKTRIFITDRPSWEVLIGQSNEGSVLSRSALGQEPLISTSMGFFHDRKKCKDFGLVLDLEKADYAFIFDGRTRWDQQNVDVMVVHMKGKEVIYAGDAMRHANVIKDACKAVKKDLAPPQ